MPYIKKHAVTHHAGEIMLLLPAMMRDGVCILVPNV